LNTFDVRLACGGGGRRIGNHGREQLLCPLQIVLSPCHRGQAGERILGLCRTVPFGC
jgi:hypothetical protein